MDLRAVELLCSRLCHELVNPIGAIRNGIELIEEMGGDTADEAIALIAHSANQAKRRLQLLRLAYGAAGADGGSSFADARQAAVSYFDGAKVALDWPLARLEAVDAGRAGLAKMILNLLMLGEEALPYGGTVSVQAQGGVRVLVQGRAAGLRPEIRQALDGRVAAGDLTPRTIHAYATGRFAEQYGLRLGVVEAAERLELSLGP